MARICPQCSQTNQDDTTFCRFCGYRFPESGQAVSDDATVRPASLASIPPDADPGSTLKPSEQPQPAPLAQPTPVAQPTPLVLTPQPQSPSQPQPAFPPPVATPNPAQSQAPFMPAQPQQAGYPPMQTPYGQPPYGQVQ